MENLIRKYEVILFNILKKHNVSEIIDIKDTQDRTRAKDMRDFIEDLKELQLYGNRGGGMMMG